MHQYINVYQCIYKCHFRVYNFSSVVIISTVFMLARWPAAIHMIVHGGTPESSASPPAGELMLQSQPPMEDLAHSAIKGSSFGKEDH